MDKSFLCFISSFSSFSSSGGARVSAIFLSNSAASLLSERSSSSFFQELLAKVVANKDVYTNIANSSWKKEDELRSLKSEAAELDRKIALTLAPPEGEKEETEEMKQGEGLSDHYHSGGVKNESYLVQDKEDNSRLQSFRPKWRH